MKDNIIKTEKRKGVFDMNSPLVSVIVPVYNNGKFIEGTLASIKKQSFTDFEIIVVNDGSTDNSEFIIDDFVSTDARFVNIRQDNKGVSVARNAGIDVARGKYIGFIDGDDTVPANAFKSLSLLTENDPDIILGGIERIDGLQSKVNKRIKRVTEKANISKDDIDMLHGWSACNRWYLKSVIDRHHIRFENFKHLEDAVFQYNFLQYAEKIVATEDIVYSYHKRLPQYGSSTTQDIKEGLIDAAAAAYHRLADITEDWSDDFKKELAYRTFNAPILSDYYRRIWKLNEEDEAKLISFAEEVWTDMSEKERNKVVEANKDFQFKKSGSVSKKAIIEDPALSIYIDRTVGADHINGLLQSLYDQSLSSFEVLLNDQFRVAANNIFSNMPNLAFTDHINSITDKVKGKFLVIVDHDMIFDHDSLRSMYKKLTSAQSDFISVMISQIKDDKPIPVKEIKDSFDKGNLDADRFLFNKMLLISSLKEIKFVFSGEGCKDTKKLFNALKYQRDKKNCVYYKGEYITTFNVHDKEQKSLVVRVKNKIKRMISKSDVLKTGGHTKDGILDYYLDYSIRENTVLLEGLGKQPNGTMYYIMQSLRADKYRDIALYYVVTADFRDYVRRELNNKGLGSVKTVVAGSKKYKELLFSAKYLVNEVEFPTYWIKKEGQIYINTWHGTPIKKLGKAKAGGIIHNDGTTQRNFIMADYLLYPNEYTKDHLLRDCYVEHLVNGKALMLGYPRTGILFDMKKREEVRRKYALGNEHIIVYMPTWRDDSGKDDYTDYVFSMLKTIDSDLKDGYSFFVHLHHKMDSRIDYSAFKKIRRFPVEYDTYEFLCGADCLISDYSSIFFDFAVTRKKIILHCPDREQYEKSRGLYMDINNLPFPVTATTSGLLEEIYKGKEYDDTDFLKQFCGFDSINNADNLCDVLINQNEKNVTAIKINDSVEEQILLYSDGFESETATRLLYEVCDCGFLPDNILLSYISANVETDIKSAYPLLEKVPGIGIKGKKYVNYNKPEGLEYEVEKDRMFKGISFEKVIVYDTIEIDKIKTFTEFDCQVCFFLQNNILDLLEGNNESLFEAVRKLMEKAKGIYTCDYDNIARIKKLYGVETNVLLINNVDRLKGVLINR